MTTRRKIDLPLDHGHVQQIRELSAQQGLSQSETIRALLGIQPRRGRPVRYQNTVHRHEAPSVLVVRVTDEEARAARRRAQDYTPATLKGMLLERLDQAIAGGLRLIPNGKSGDPKAPATTNRKERNDATP